MAGQRKSKQPKYTRNLPAGVKEIPQKVTRQELIIYVRAYVRILGRLPRIKDFYVLSDKKGFPCYATFVNHLGPSLREIHKAAGFNSTPRTNERSIKSSIGYNRETQRAMKRAMRFLMEEDVSSVFTQAVLFYDRAIKLVDENGDLRVRTKDGKIVKLNLRGNF